MMPEESEPAAEEESVDDPTWRLPDRDTTDHQSEAEDIVDIPEPAQKKRRKSSKGKSKEEKLAKCPHCFREFTNLKHHINQQHAQVEDKWQELEVFVGKCSLRFVTTVYIVQ